MPFDPLPEPPHRPEARRQRENDATFPCGMCSRRRVDEWALAYKPGSFVVCRGGALRRCDLCNGACIE